MGCCHFVDEEVGNSFGCRTKNTGRVAPFCIRSEEGAPTAVEKINQILRPK